MRPKKVRVGLRQLANLRHTSLATTSTTSNDDSIFSVMISHILYFSSITSIIIVPLPITEQSITKQALPDADRPPHRTRLTTAPATAPPHLQRPSPVRNLSRGGRKHSAPTSPLSISLKGERTFIHSLTSLHAQTRLCQSPPSIHLLCAAITTTTPASQPARQLLPCPRLLRSTKHPMHRSLQHHT